MKLPRITLYTLVLLLAALLCTAALPSYAEPNVSLTINVVGQGDVNVNPPPPYSNGQVVTLTAVPDAGWTFDGWDLAGDGTWWDSDWDYRVKISSSANGTARKNKPAEADLNFTQLLTSLGKSGTIDPNSIRVIEVNNSNVVVDENVPFQFDPAADFNATTKAAGKVVLIMKGNTAAGATRHYHVYFDVTGKGFAPPSVTPQVTFTDNVLDEDRSSYRIENNHGTYFYDKKGGGFISLDDNNGNDWIDYNDAPDAAGVFRGIPNMVRPSNGGHFHPGANTSETALLNQGPIKVTITSIVPKRTNRWEAVWEFYPDYVKMTVLDAGYDYWFLYEGTPGGVLEVNSDYVVRSDGTQTNASVDWTEALSPEQWAYVVDPEVDRALFLVQHNPDDAIDSYAPSTLNEMAIFGFGRNGAIPLIDNEDLPNYFTIGLLENTAFATALQTIKDAYKDLNVTAAAAEVRPGAALGSQNPVNFTITGDHTITATFVPAQYTLTVTTSGEGTVAKSPNKPTYDHGEMVTLTANPGAGYAFAGWSGTLSGTTNPQTIEMLGDRAVTANFAQAFTITTSTDGNGTITLNPNLPTYVSGREVTITAVPNGGYALASWGGALSGTQNPQTINVTSNLTISATFTETQYTLTVNKLGNGTITKTPDLPAYDFGQVVTLTATADTGWAFTGWSGGVTATENPLAITIEDNTSLTGTFSEQEFHTLDVTTVGQGTVSRNPITGPYLAGTEITLTATPAAGWAFAGWSGDLTGSDNPLVFLISQDTTATATFIQETYQVNITPIGQGSVTKNPNKTDYAAGESVTLTATPNTGWTFAGWGGSLSGTTNPLTITISGDVAGTATFVTGGPFTLDTNVNGDGDITVEPVKAQYEAGETVTLTAEPAPGWVFAGWSGDLSGGDNPETLIMNEDKVVSATFIQPGQLTTDGFNTCTLNSGLWTFVDPRGDSSYEVTGTTLEITVPSTEEGHNIWTDGNNAARLMQAADDSDFQIQARFNSEVLEAFQLQGILIEEDADNFIRFDSFFARDGLLHIYVQTFNNTVPSKKADITIASTAPIFMQVTRAGDEWTMEYSTDGTNWEEVVVFDYGLNVVSVGVFAGNAQERRNELAPAHTAIVDYFYNTADGSVPVDSSLLQVNTIGQGSVQKNPDQDVYTCGQSVTLSAAPAPGASFAGWTGDIESLTNPLVVNLTAPTTVNAVFEGAGRYSLYLPLATGDPFQ